MGGRKPHGETRRKILDALRRREILSAADLAGELGIGAVAVRQHLAQLQQEQLVMQAGVQHGAGRPRQLYRLTQEAMAQFPHAYARLALDLLHCVGDQDRALIERLFVARQELHARRYGPALSGLPLEERVPLLADMLSEQGYMAECCLREDGTWEITQHNCPIDKVAGAYPQACRCERELYQQLLAVPVESESTIVDGASCCRYHIKA
jgi:predicted ArsR family transcriptional regulator